MTSALEKVARALAEAHGRIVYGGEDYDTWEEATEEEREAVRQIAKAALSALLNPDEGTIEAMAEMLSETEGFGDHQRAEQAFVAAIYHILGEGAE